MDAVNTEILELSDQIDFFAKKRDWEKVQRYCEENLKNLTAQESLLYLRAMYMNKNFQICLKYSGRLIDQDPSNIGALRFRARSATKIQLKSSIIIDYWNELLGEVPNDQESKVNIARALLSNDDISDSLALIEEVISNGVAYEPAFSTLIKIAERGNKENNKDIEYRAIKHLEDLSETNLRSAILLSRHLIYFSEVEEDNYAKINRLYQIHGVEILEQLLSFILKSGKIDFIVKANLAKNLPELLDPVSGILGEKIGYKKSFNFHKKFENKIKNLLRNSNQKLNYEFHPTHLAILDRKLIDIQITQDSIDRMMNSIKPHAYSYETSDIDQKKVLFFCKANQIELDRLIDNDFSTNSRDVDRNIIFQIKSDYSSSSCFSYEIKNGVTVLATKDRISDDPRIVLGRFTSMLDGLNFSQMRTLSVIITQIIEHSPKKIHYSSEYFETQLACAILGYDFARLSEIQSKF